MVVIPGEEAVTVPTLVAARAVVYAGETIAEELKAVHASCTLNTYVAPLTNPVPVHVVMVRFVNAVHPAMDPLPVEVPPFDPYDTIQLENVPAPSLHIVEPAVQVMMISVPGLASVPPRPIEDGAEGKMPVVKADVVTATEFAADC
jgi:hypothetical protein